MEILEVNEINSKKIYDSDFLENDNYTLKTICEVDKRRKCDSLYIELVKKYKKKINKTLKLLDKDLSKEELIKAIRKELEIKEEI